MKETLESVIDSIVAQGMPRHKLEGVTTMKGARLRHIVWSTSGEYKEDIAKFKAKNIAMKRPLYEKLIKFAKENPKLATKIWVYIRFIEEGSLEPSLESNLNRLLSFNPKAPQLRK